MSHDEYMISECYPAIYMYLLTPRESELET